MKLILEMHVLWALGLFCVLVYIVDARSSFEFIWIDLKKLVVCCSFHLCDLFICHDFSSLSYLDSE